MSDTSTERDQEPADAATDASSPEAGPAADGAIGEDGAAVDREPEADVEPAADHESRGVDGTARRDGDADAQGADDPEADGERDHDGTDDEVAAPIIGCLRCDARVPLGSRYCPRCGTPLVRSGEDAAVRLSRTRRNAPLAVRVLVPAIVAAIVGVVLWVAVIQDPNAAFEDDLQAALERAVSANRDLSSVLVELRSGADRDPARARAEAALATVQAARDDVDALDVPSGDEGRVIRAGNALSTDATYLATVVAVLRDPRTGQLDRLGRSSAQAAAALRSISDEVRVDGAIDGTRELGRYARSAREGDGARSGREARAAGGGSPFLDAIDRVLADQRPTYERTRRAFALLRAARDGVTSFPRDRGAAPADAGEALRDARTLMERIATERTAGAGAARGVATRQENQRSIVAKLAAALDASSASADELARCLDETGDAVTVAGRCLTQVRAASEREDEARTAFLQSIAPARQAVDRPALTAAF